MSFRTGDAGDGVRRQIRRLSRLRACSTQQQRRPARYDPTAAAFSSMLDNHQDGIWEPLTTNFAAIQPKLQKVMTAPARRQWRRRAIRHRSAAAANSGRRQSRRRKLRTRSCGHSGCRPPSSRRSRRRRPTSRRSLITRTRPRPTWTKLDAFRTAQGRWPRTASGFGPEKDLQSLLTERPGSPPCADGHVQTSSFK